MPAPRSRLLWSSLAAILFGLISVRLVHLRSRPGATPYFPAAAVGAPSKPPSTTAPTSAPTQSPPAAATLPQDTFAWIQVRFPASRILEQRQTPPDRLGKSDREILLESHFKYPLVEIDEHLERDDKTGADVVRTREAFAADHFLLRPRPEIGDAGIEAAAAQAGGRIDRDLLAAAGVDLVYLPAGKLGDLKAAVAAYADPKSRANYAEPDYLYFSQEIPDDPDFPLQTGLSNPAHPGDDIDAPAGWNLRTSAADIIVAVIDTGVRYTHQDLQANMWHDPQNAAVHGYNFYANTSDPNDDNGHGTHVSGILGACGNNGIGIAGVAWQVQIMALKFLDANGVGASSDATRAIYYGMTNGAKVMNNSWGGGSFSVTLHEALFAAGESGIPCICAAGNDGQDDDTYPFYPACDSAASIISVGNLDVNGPAASSDYGAASVAIFAPGVNIYSLSNSSDSGYMSLTGTSMSAAFVSGIMALVRAQNPGENLAWLKGRVLDATVPMSSLTGFALSGGRVDLYRCLAGVYRAPVKIVTPPIAAAGDSGNSITLSVVVTGGGALQYQWYQNGVALVGQTSATLTITAVTQGQYGIVTISGNVLDYSPVYGYFGPDQFTYTIKNASGATATANVFVQNLAAHVYFPATTLAAASGSDAPGAGQANGPPPGAKLASFGPPALSDTRALASTVALTAGNHTLDGILFIGEDGTLALPAFTGAPAPGLSQAGFRSFSNPVLSPPGAIAFIAKANAPNHHLSQGVWTNAFTADGSLALALEAGDTIVGPDLPAGAPLQGITSIDLHDSVLYVLGQLSPSHAAVLLRIDAAGTRLLAREQGFLPDGEPIEKLSVFQPSASSPGDGRWDGDAGLVASASSANHSTVLFRIAPDGSVSLLASTRQFPDPFSASPWDSLGLPSLAPDKVAFRAATNGRSQSEIDVFNFGNGAIDSLVVGDNAPDTSAATWASFSDPLVNAGSLAFFATLNHDSVSAANSRSLWFNNATYFGILAQIGQGAPDASGIPSGPLWNSFTSLEHFRVKLSHIVHV